MGVKEPQPLPSGTEKPLPPPPPPPPKRDRVGRLGRVAYSLEDWLEIAELDLTE